MNGPSFANLDERLAALRAMDAEDRHLMLCYIAGLSPAVFDQAYADHVTLLQLADASEGQEATL